jgi:methionyl-tRNA formyltransferase
VPLVLTQPDRPAGRGMRSAPGAVKRLALARGLEVFQPETLRDARSLARIAAARPDALAVAAYGLILPPAALDAAPHGAINIHASLLPRWRGAAPIQRALMAGDRETGITIMRMDAGLDTGPMLAQERVPIACEDDAQTLHDRLAALGARMIVVALSNLAAGREHAAPQPESGATYARKITKIDTQIDWQGDAGGIERLVRALRPHPGAVTRWRGEALKIWAARCEPVPGAPGTVLQAGNDGIVVACGKGSLRALELQRAGGRRLAVGEFLRGCLIAVGERLQ